MKIKLRSVICILFIFALYPFNNKTIKAGEENSALATASESMNRFAMDFYRQAMKQQGNIVFSPAGVYSAILLIHPGSVKDTKTEIEKTLHMKLKSPHEHYGNLLKLIEARENKWSLFFANSLWFNNNIKIKNDYTNILKTGYSVETGMLNFQTDAKTSADIMNKWVEDKTMGKIKDLLQYGGDVTEDTKFILINTIYFKSPWISEFFSIEGLQHDFWITPGKIIRVPMIQSPFNVSGVKKKAFTAVVIPYLDRKRSMILIIPKKKGGLASIEKSLSAEFLSDLYKGIRGYDGLFQIKMPTFNLSKKTDITETLKNMGMVKTFKNPDLSGISSSGDLSFAKAIQKVFIDVNKTGTEAAAATAFIEGATGMAEIPEEVIADRPYLFLITDSKTGVILFMGRITNPLEKGE